MGYLYLSHSHVALDKLHILSVQSRNSDRPRVRYRRIGAHLMICVASEGTRPELEADSPIAVYKQTNTQGSL